MITGTVLRKFAAVFVDLSPLAGHAPPEASAPDEHVNHITLSFWLVLLAGFVLLFGFEPTQMQELAKTVLKVDHINMTPFESWEVGALVWNALFAIYFYWKVPPTNNLIVEKITPVIIFCGVILFTGLALRTLLSHDAFQHVLYVLFIGVLFLLVDAVHARFQKSPRHKQEFLQCLLLADLPMVPAFAVLVFYQGYFAHIVQDKDVVKNLEVFLSGAISFQLLASTLIFACIQAGVFHHAFGWIRNPGHAAPETPLQRGAAA